MVNIAKQAVNIVPDNEYEILRLQKDIGSELIMNMKAILQESGIDFTGDLSNSFTLVMLGGKAWIESDSPYGGLVDRGMRGGTYVNYDALKDWVRIKIGLEEPELTPVTWAIVNSIQKDGIRPTRFVKKAIKRLIGSHGASSTRTVGSGKKRSKFSKKLNKLSKFVNKIKRGLNKVSKNINKVSKPIGRYK